MEGCLREVESMIHGDYAISKRSLATLLLQEDQDASALAREKEKDFGAIHTLVEQAQGRFPHPVSYEFALERQRIASRIVHEAVRFSEGTGTSWAEWLSRRMISPWTGHTDPSFHPLLWDLQVCWRLRRRLFSSIFSKARFLRNMLIHGSRSFVVSLLPWKIVQDLLVGEYGVITLGVRYAVALILPIVTTFFLAFSILEDTGYLPRLSLLIDRLFKTIGLTGRAVIPMVLGLGCDTMATMVTRTLPTVRERIIATLLLALAIPCSAQLGVLLALFEGKPAVLWIWLGIMASVFLLVGFLSSMVMPGEKPSFYMEIPPFRLPKISNVITKTYTRVHWYFKEIFPMFVLASFLIWLGQITGLFDLLVRGLEYPIRLLGLPDKSAVSFLFGFLQTGLRRSRFL